MRRGLGLGLSRPQSGGGAAPIVGTVAIMSPVAGTILYTSVQYTVSGTCSNCSQVEVFWDGVSIGTDVTVAGGLWSISWTPSNAQASATPKNITAIGTVPGGSPASATPVSATVANALTLVASVPKIGWYRSTENTTGAQWSDLSGNNNNFVQAVSGARPAYVASDAGFNNRPCLTFDGIDDFLQCSTIDLNAPSVTPTCIIFVARLNAWASQKQIICTGSSVSVQIYCTGVSPTIAQRNGVSANSNSAWTLGNVKRILAAYTNSTNDRLLIGSTNVTGTNAANNNAAIGVWLAANNGVTSFTQLSAGELYLLAGIPNTAEINALTSYYSALYTNSAVS